jgi:hypothetical protein
MDCAKWFQVEFCQSNLLKFLRKKPSMPTASARRKDLARVEILTFLGDLPWFRGLGMGVAEN